LQGQDIIARRLDPARVGRAAQHQHWRGRRGGQMRCSRIVGDDKTRRFAERWNIENRRLAAKIDQPWAAGLSDAPTFLDLIRAADQCDAL